MQERALSGGAQRTVAAFKFAMERFGPYENNPHFAVACSGGADSLALTVLLHEQVASLGGMVTALTVDHGLRENARAEAEATGKVLDGLGIRQEILTWSGPRPASGIQAAARDARYRLMFEWCRENAVLHLFLGHHALDQAETLILRQRKGSGESGLSAMPAIRDLPDLRLVRPLLAVNPQDLRCFLSDRELAWIEDPSNRDRRFTRVRLREELQTDAAGRVSELAGSARGHGLVRDQTERRLAGWFARHAQLDPFGCLLLGRGAFKQGSDTDAKALLARALMTVGGAVYPPRGRALEGLLSEIAAGKSFRRTLGGCLIEGRLDDLLIFRELALTTTQPMVEARFLWDGRFLLSVSAEADYDERLGDREFRAAALGNKGWKGLCDANAESNLRAKPHPARLAIPAIWQGDKLVAVPLAGWYCPDWPKDLAVKCRFRPIFPLSAGGFTVVQNERHII